MTLDTGGSHTGRERMSLGWAFFCSLLWNLVADEPLINLEHINEIKLRVTQMILGYLILQGLPSGKYAGLGHNNIIHYLRGNLLRTRSDHMISTYVFDRNFDPEDISKL